MIAFATSKSVEVSQKFTGPATYVEHFYLEGMWTWLDNWYDNQQYKLKELVSRCLTKHYRARNREYVLSRASLTDTDSQVGRLAGCAGVHMIYIFVYWWLPLSSNFLLSTSQEAGLLSYLLSTMCHFRS